ncbi:MAG: carbon-nitrogen hydrolase family protein [Candidatus Latescibacteria bacterium]|nr:carbon-nitrogen hydrolase family protein [Candidatus Latescibacterota bacterium]
MKLRQYTIPLVIVTVIMVLSHPAYAQFKRPSEFTPRKVVVGTVIHGYYGVPYPGLDKRLTEVENLIDKVATESEKKYPGEGLDLVVLPEEVITIGKGRTAKDRSVPLRGPVLDRMGKKARQYSTYLVVPLDLTEENGTTTNAAVLLDRGGKVVGIYRKVHLVDAQGKTPLEGGHTPGTEYPVFDCDFGRLAVQICYDLNFPEGWQTLFDKGVEIIVVPTMSPQTVRPTVYASNGHCYIVTSNHRNNATIFNPGGRIVAQIDDGDNELVSGTLRLTQNAVLVHRIDLSYAIVSWSATLGDGRLFTEKYGDNVGYSYYRDEDYGIFWSNDPILPVRRMVQELGLVEMDEQLKRSKQVQDEVRGGPAK